MKGCCEYSSGFSQSKEGGEFLDSLETTNLSRRNVLLGIR
jgi:hypothetical protein